MCFTPFTKRNEAGSFIPHPCGKCPQCRKRRANGWAFRLEQQLKSSSTANFITLTYDNKHVPITSNYLLSLDKVALQLYFKRLRKAHSQEDSIKYYATGEYGGKTGRPHYHILLFNADINKIDEPWSLGNIHYGQVNGASIAYTLKYMHKSKKQQWGKWIYGDCDNDRQPPFALMSKGLGQGYISKAMVNWHKQDVLNRGYVNIEGGKKVSMPRYYKDKIYEWWERNMIAEQMVKQMDLQQIANWNKENFFLNNSEAIKAAFDNAERLAEKTDKL